MKTRVKLVAIALLAALTITGCGSNIYEEHKNGYTEVTSVGGISFDMPSSILEQSTAITSISKDQEYGENTYLYKDGKGSYLLFNISAIVVAVEANTNYDLSNASDKKTSIEGSSMDNIWFTADGKSLDYTDKKSDKGYKLIATVDADVSVTQDIYGTFAGKLAHVSDENGEYTMFVGIRGDSYKDLDGSDKDLIEHIAASLTLVPSEGTEVNAEKEESSEVTKKTSEGKQDSTSTKDEPSKKDNDATVEKDQNNDDSIDVEAEDVNLGEATVSDGTEDAVDTAEDDKTKTSADAPKEPTANNTSRKSKEYVTKGSNQSKGKNGYSDIYHMLDIGEDGYFAARNPYIETGASTSFIRIDELYTGDTAVDIVKKWCGSGKAAYEYFEPDPGYSWHVIRYTVADAPNAVYTNIKVEGLDGERLKFHGISCTTRTYDIFYDETSGTDLYCFYAVPNGCKEYMLEIGDRISSSTDTACYHIIVE